MTQPAAYRHVLNTLMQIITTISAIKSFSTASPCIRRFSCLPSTPPPKPPAAIRTSTGQRNSGTELVRRVVSRLQSWLKKMIYRLLAAAPPD